MKALLQNEKLLSSYIFANISLEGVRHVIHLIQPELTAILTVIQIVVGVLTIIHVYRKWKKSHEIVHPDSP